ncbi:hypothetical protein DTL70_29130 [Streptomyces diacarni]|uniref:Lipoprotein n=1 Tax=Streptomyces diacarni TaxID=2800381 RepID=A0A367EG00_9ACTN|nr:hypothetical protein [Streptomyces diacarni]RCG16287.1 hypothetical protein DTL70_29130 [Streptomyces diacarni]
MRLARPAHPMAAATAAAVFLLAGCGGGGDGSKDDKIDGAGGSADKSASPSKSGAPAEGDTADFRTSDIELPDDIDMVFAWEKPADDNKAAALDGAADYMRALNHGTVEQDPKDPVLLRHTIPLQTAAEFATAKIKADVKEGLTVTGKERIYNEEVGDMVKGNLIEVAFCVDQSDFFSKEIKTGKTRRTEASDKDYTRLTLVMQKPKQKQRAWKARTFLFEGEAVEKCKG